MILAICGAAVQGAKGTAAVVIFGAAVLYVAAEIVVGTFKSLSIPELEAT